ncbi:MAG: GNAT family N-acetyltransferase [Anaerolineae bacterium]|jgi:ribosomal protein S18 acetylase RimI-like enzyme|nr:GNAT family N-acetyltransferase [Anaerolineae bacterium]
MASEKVLSESDWLAQVRLRHVRREDLPELEWDGEYTHFRRVFAQGFQRARSGLSILWVAELPGSGVIGQVFIQLTCDRPELADGMTRAYLYAFRIKPPYRNAGLGTHMLQTVWEDVVRRGFGELTLTVGKDNPDARRMYERHGFRVVAEEPGVWYYPDHQGVYQRVEEPAWRMVKRIS